jgi:hypothetical protein
MHHPSSFAAIVILASAATVEAAAAASSPCEFSLWKLGGTCQVLDLSAMPSTVWRMNDSYPDAYAVTAPCAHVRLGSGASAATCNSSAVQNPHGTTDCGLLLGMRRENSTAALPSGEAGMRITMAGGTGGRTLVYDMICDRTVPPTAGPSGLVGTHVGGFPNPALTYLITWRTPHACGQRRRQQQLLGTGRCGAANVAVPTANQLRYQTGEIVALTHFNMASFVKNGDPGCTSQNWLTKAPGAVGPSGDPATFNRTPSTPACISTYLSCLPACAGSYPLPPVGRCVCVSATQLDTDQWAEVYRSFGEH